VGGKVKQPVPHNFVIGNMTEKNNKTARFADSVKAEWMPISFGKDKREADMRRVLASIPLFENLSSRDWRDLAGLFHFRTFTNNEVIFRYDTPGLGMYIIIEGYVSILARELDADVEIARLGQGDFFGEMSLVEDVERSASAVSSGTTRLIGIFRPQLRDLMHRRPRLGLILMERLARIITHRLREANQKLVEWREKQILGAR